MNIAQNRRPFIWAHRGASRIAPENTLAAFQRAVACGADGLELDVHLSRDGIPVVIHDETLDRTTDGSGAVAEWDFASLRCLDAGGWFDRAFAGEPIPSLAEVLRVLAGRIRLNLEIKEVRAGEAVLALLDCCPEADVVVSSFNPSLLRTMRASMPELPLAVLVDHAPWRRALALAQEIDAVALNPSATLVSRPLVTACRNRHLPVHVWTVDRLRQARSFLRMGVEGIFTNDPGRLCAAESFHARPSCQC